MALDTSVESALELSSKLNPLYIQNFKAAMNTVAPGAADQLAGNISGLLRGELPADVRAQIAQSAAELNLSQGRFGEAAGFRTMRDIGKTSLDAMTMGEELLKKFTPQLPDLATLVQQQRVNDLEKSKMRLEASQFDRQLAQKQAEFAEQSASEKLRITLAQKQQDDQFAEQRRQFDTKQKWEETVSSWNQKYQDTITKFGMQELAAKKANESKLTNLGESLIRNLSATTPSASTAVGTPVSSASVPTYSEASIGGSSPTLGVGGVGIVGETGDKGVKDNTDLSEFFRKALAADELMFQ